MRDTKQLYCRRVSLSTPSCFHPSYGYRAPIRASSRICDAFHDDRQCYGTYSLVQGFCPTLDTLLPLA